MVGGGLAGLNAALQAARLGLVCTAFAGATPGGLLLSIDSVQGLAEHPEGIPGYDLGPMTLEAAMDAGARCIGEEAEHIERDGDRWRVAGGGQQLRARALVLATGSTLRALGVPGEARLAGKGVSHCASCDAPLLRGREVAVVGGGDAACQEALTLDAQASRVHLLVRGGALRAQAAWRDRVAAQANIAPRFGVQVDEVVGDSAVTGLRLDNGELLPVQALFVYAGLVPRSALLRGLVELDATGHVRVDDHLRTSAPGVFAAGSVRTGSSGQAAQALSDGVAAAQATHDFLKEAPR